MELTIKKHMRSKDDDGLNDYIESLENYILGLQASNTNRLIFKLDEVNGLIADDLDMIINGNDWESTPMELEGLSLDTGFSKLKVLSDSKDSKTFERIMVLYTKVKDIKSVADMVKAMVPKDEEEEIKKQKEVEEGKGIIDPTVNAFEQKMSEIKTKGKQR